MQADAPPGAPTAPGMGGTSCPEKSGLVPQNPYRGEDFLRAGWDPLLQHEVSSSGEDANLLLVYKINLLWGQRQWGIWAGTHFCQGLSLQLGPSGPVDLVEHEIAGRGPLNIEG